MLVYNEQGCVHWEAGKAAGLLCPLTRLAMRHARLVNIPPERTRAPAHNTQHINNSRRLEF
jgi:hypothetical protein